MSIPDPAFQLFVGVDIAAKSAAVAWRGLDIPHRRPFTIQQSPAGFADLQHQLAATHILPAATLVVMEATASYWVRLATFLHAGGFAVCVINPKQARDFAKATLQHAKSDALDAKLLAELAAQLQPPRWTPPPQIYHELQQRLALRDSLIALRQQLHNQHFALQHEQVIIASVAARQQELLEQLAGEIKTLEQEIQALSEQEDAWAKSILLLQSIPGVGLLTAAWVVVATMNFTACANAQAASSFAGLAPYVHSSGSSVHRRPQIGGPGDKRLRKALYMASVSASHCNPQLQPFYKRLRDGGKPAKLALCAVARKLLHLMWAVGSKQRPFDPAHQQPVGAQLMVAAAAAA